MTKQHASRQGEDWLDNQPIREAVEEAEAQGLQKSVICDRLGWYRKDKRGKRAAETSQLDRRIGRRHDMGRNGETYYSRTIHYDVAVKICRAIDRDPVELGL
jgi:hypothetical protein